MLKYKEKRNNIMTRKMKLIVKIYIQEKKPNYIEIFENFTRDTVVMCVDIYI